MPVDPRAERAFGSRADAYDRHRPGWPAKAVERALAELDLGPDSTVVDLAAGTGKLTRELVPRVARVVAVEPSEDMLRQLADAVPEADPVEGTAESIPLDDAAVDAVFVAEAFHWFATPEAVAEIARVLRPRGGLALLWNLYDWGKEEWLDEVGALFGEHLAPAVAAADRNRVESWQGAFEGSPFGPFENFAVRHELRTDTDGLIAHIGTWSPTRMLEETERGEFLRKLEDLLRRAHPSPDDIAIRFRTQVHWTRLR
jgi:ubiquinone/menaquinone biosynthesis C-methylase UbiE